jgi:hypothetical protein
MAACGSIETRKHRKSAHATINRRIEKSNRVHASPGIRLRIQSVQVACGSLHGLVEFTNSASMMVSKCEDGEEKEFPCSWSTTERS